MSYETMPPVIKLKLDHMRHTMMEHLGLCNEELSKAVGAQLKCAIETFDFQSAVLKASNEAIQEVITSYFKYGEGRKLIQSSIQSSFDAMFKNNQPRQEAK